MNNRKNQSRREFIHRSSLASLACIAGSSMNMFAAGAPEGNRFPVMAFSKAFQHLNANDTARLVDQVGWDGIECPVRKGGHIIPERVEEDLPKMVEALQARGKRVIQITTDIKKANDPQAEKVLRIAARLGIRSYRLAQIFYQRDRSIPDQLKERNAELKDLMALNKELGMCAGMQNHSGINSMGAPVWDIWHLIKDLDPRFIGICFDIGHATVEGGYAWILHSRLMEPFYNSIYIKDFRWSKGPKGWQAEWCPLGEGMIHREFITQLLKSSFQGPISQHFEYPTSSFEESVKAYQQDLKALKTWLNAPAPK